MNYYVDRQNRENAIREYHQMTDTGKFRGWTCSCEYEFGRMQAFKEAYDKWLS